MTTCRRDPSHVYPPHNQTCPWCAIASTPPAAAKRSVVQQTPLPPPQMPAAAPLTSAPVRPAVRPPTPASVTRAPSAVSATSASAPPSSTSTTTRTSPKKGKVGWILLLVGAAIAGGAYQRHSTPPAAWASLVGQCATLQSWSNAALQSPTPVIATVDCGNPHEVEIFAAVNPNGRGLFLTEWPGEDSVREQTIEACRSKFESYVGVPLGESEFGASFSILRENAWDLGVRTSLCAIKIEDGTTGTVKGSQR